MLRRSFIASLVAVYLFALPGCATTSSAASPDVTPEQQCRRMRGAAAGRGIGWTIGAVLLVGVAVVAVAAGGNTSPNFGGGGGDRAERRQARRAARGAACEQAHADPGEVPVNAAVASAGAPPSGPEADAPPPGVTDLPEEPGPGGGPISRVELHEALLPHVDALRACAPAAEGTLIMDARIDGATGRVTGILLQGPIAPHVPTSCVSLVTANIQVRTFDGVADVRWAVRYPE